MPYFSLKDHRIFYREQGAGPLLFILPGNTASSACHAGELEYFARHYRVVSFDFWGTGQSERLASWPETWWETGAYDAAALIEHLGERQAFVMGTSSGGIVALLLAILIPERVHAVIADSCLERYPAALLRMVVAERKQRTEKQIAFWQFAHGDDWQQVVEADSHLLLKASESGVFDWAQGRLQNLRCPVLLTASLCDKSLPDVGVKFCRMAEQIPECRVFLVNAGDHPLMWSRQKDFFYASESFLKNAVI